jgi:PAS domain S-box-containing protein
MKNHLSRILDNIDVLVYVADLETYEVLYINKYTQNIFGDIKGNICWQTIQQGQKSPCQFCTNDKILNSDGTPAGVYHWEFQNTVTGQWFDIRDSAIEWHDGRLVRLEVATDITHLKKIEESLQESTRILIESQEIAEIGSYVLDIAAGTWESSKMLDSIFGLDENFVRSVEGWASIIHPEDKKQMIDYFTHDVLEKKGIFNREYRILRLKDGEERWVHGCGEVEYDKNNIPVKMIGTIQDITERKKAEEDLMIKDSAIESSLSAIGITDAEGKILYVNDSILRMWGYEYMDEVLGRSLPEFFDGDRVYITIENTLKKGGDIGEDRGKRKDGSVFDVQFSSSLIKDKAAQPKYFFGSFLDITKRKKAEKEQERLTAELLIKNKELEQVLYVTSHDLRSPLVNIEGYSRELDYSINELMSSLDHADIPSSIKDKISPIVKEDIHESLHYIKISVSKINTLLKGILKLSRVGQSEQTIAEIDMNKMMTDIVDSHSYRLKELEIKMEVSKLPACKGDISEINQVFSNLLDNAIKYADSERSCVINISGYMDKNQLVYCIQDNGIGIAPEHQDRIFDIFHQLEPHRVEGEGMGLTIAMRIIEKHNGKIWIESELGRGSKFFVSLPKV